MYGVGSVKQQLDCCNDPLFTIPWPVSRSKVPLKCKQLLKGSGQPHSFRADF